tara:strand:+ start:2945 stop:4270 length:1326 start_codon:yes stop_codon:yes gene_type:complete
MAADQTLINAVKRMGPSRFRDDSGWIKALGAVGKYVAVKQKQFSQATENFNGVVEDVDIDGLVQYKEEVNGLLKTMKNVPAFMPKYKKAANRYNEIMSNVEGTKTLLSSLAKKKVLIGENANDLSSYKSASEIATDADVMNSKYTTRMSESGPVMVFNNGASEILVSDYVSSNPMLISSAQTSIDASFELIKKNGSTAKIQGLDYSAETVAQDVTSFVDKSWRGKNNEKTTLSFDVAYQTQNGPMTFMDYYADKQENYRNALIKSREDVKAQNLGPVSEQEVIEQEANILKRELWKNSSEEALKQTYKDFLQEVTRFQYDQNESRYANKNEGSKKSKKVGANGFVRNYALSTEDPTKLKFDPDQEYVGFKTPEEIKEMEVDIDSGQPFVDWFMHRYTPVFDRKDPKKIIGFTVVLESNTKLPQMMPYQKVKNNLLGRGALD